MLPEDGAVNFFQDGYLGIVEALFSINSIVVYDFCISSRIVLSQQIAVAFYCLLVQYILALNRIRFSMLLQLHVLSFKSLFPCEVPVFFTSKRLFLLGALNTWNLSSDTLGVLGQHKYFSPKQSGFAAFTVVTVRWRCGKLKDLCRMLV